MQANTNLKIIRLSHCGINNESMSKLCIGLCNNKSITSLDLSGNNLTPKILDYFMNCELELRSLNLGDNNLKDLPELEFLRKYY